MKVATLLVTGVWIASASLYAQFAVAQGAQPAPQAQASTSSSADQQPSDIVQSAAQGILKELDANRDAYRKDPNKIGTLVDKYLLPHFDTEYAARLVLGQYWRTATPEQKKRFVDAFYHSLLQNYGSALADFTADKLKVFPTKVDPGADHATVRTEIKRDSGDRIAVNYVLRKTPEGWKAYDVNIDGISYVKSYREDFGSQIAQQGIDAVIARLERGEKPSDISKTTKATGSKS
ncbi:MAG TPA: ABC transporter substrate-binding protein [Steroidobacteraceae bacterium]|jgi:phospholipid transport system substrate-binding protein|nr:ABC transporter substrate-binding protein [Steroidobacteraceae bacterium]